MNVATQTPARIVRHDRSRCYRSRRRRCRQRRARPLRGRPSEPEEQRPGRSWFHALGEQRKLRCRGEDRRVTALFLAAPRTDPPPPGPLPGGAIHIRSIAAFAALAHPPRDEIAGAGLLTAHQPSEAKAERTRDEQAGHRTAVHVADCATALAVVAGPVLRGVVPRV